MDTQDLLQHLLERARFSESRMTKVDCFRTDRLLVGLNCMERGQVRGVAAHAGSAKFYFVVDGKAGFTIGDRRVEARPGGLVVAPAGVPRGVARAHERTIVLVAIAPAP